MTPTTAAADDERALRALAWRTPTTPTAASPSCSPSCSSPTPSCAWCGAAATRRPRSAAASGRSPSAVGRLRAVRRPRSTSSPTTRRRRRRRGDRRGLLRSPPPERRRRQGRRPRDVHPLPRPLPARREGWRFAERETFVEWTEEHAIAGPSPDDVRRRATATVPNTYGASVSCASLAVLVPRGAAVVGEAAGLGVAVAVVVREAVAQRRGGDVGLAAVLGVLVLRLLA